MNLKGVKTKMTMCLKSAYNIEIVDNTSLLLQQINEEEYSCNSVQISSTIIKIKRSLIRPEKPEYDQCCDNPSIIEDSYRGQSVCQNCGVVIDDRCISTDREWRSFTKEDDDKKNRVGAPTNPFLWDGGMSTKIGTFSKGGKVDLIDARSHVRDKRLKKWNDRWMVQGREQKNFQIAMGELRKFTSLFNLPSIVQEEIATLYKKSIKNKVMKGKTIKSTILAFIYIMCRRHNFPLDENDLCEKADISNKEFTRSRHQIMALLGLKSKPTRPEDHIVRIYDDLNIDDHSISVIALRTIEKARLQRGSDLFFIGKDPSGIAAASIYLTCILKKYRRTQQQISRVANVTEVTLRQRYQKLCEILGFSSNDLRGNHKKN